MRPIGRGNLNRGNPQKSQRRVGMRGEGRKRGEAGGGFRGSELLPPDRKWMRMNECIGSRAVNPAIPSVFYWLRRFRTGTSR